MAGMLRQTLGRLVLHEELTREEVLGSIDEILRGEASPVTAAAWLVALRMRGETVTEFAAVAEALRERAERICIADPEAIDTCGTGGDGAATFNISTAAAFVASGAGVTVAKHGNRAVSSKSGSADVLAALGVDLAAEIGRVRACIDSERIGFLFAQRHHPAMRFLDPVRRELAMRTVFNVAGPLANPAGVRRQLVGVYDAALLERVAATLGALGARRAWAVHGAGGLDELSLAGPTRVVELREDGTLRAFTVEPADARLESADVEAVSGGGPGHNARIIREVLQGARGPRRDAVVLNAAAALVVAGRAEDLAEGAQLAARSVDSGAALARLEALVRATGAPA